MELAFSSASKKSAVCIRLLSVVHVFQHRTLDWSLGEQSRHAACGMDRLEWRPGGQQQGVPAGRGTSCGENGHLGVSIVPFLPCCCWVITEEAAERTIPVIKQPGEEGSRM